MYHQKPEPAERLIFERNTSLLDTKEIFRRIQSISEVPGDPGQYIDHEISAAGLLNGAFLSIKKYKTREIQFKGYIKEIVKSDGRLFPLKTGNRMTLETRRWYQAPLATPKSTPALLDYSYFYEIAKEMDGYKRGDLFVPGKVFVIQYTERHPEGIDRKELFYSQTLGAVILERQESDGGFTELRLVSRE